MVLLIWPVWRYLDPAPRPLAVGRLEGPRRPLALDLIVTKEKKKKKKIGHDGKGPRVCGHGLHFCPLMMIDQRTAKDTIENIIGVWRVFEVLGKVFDVDVCWTCCGRPCCCPFDAPCYSCRD